MVAFLVDIKDEKDLAQRTQKLMEEGRR